MTDPQYLPPNTHANTPIEPEVGPEVVLAVAAVPPTSAAPPLPEKWAFASKTITGLLSAGVLIALNRLGWPGLDGYVREFITNGVDLVLVPAALGWAAHGRVQAGHEEPHRLYLLPRRQ